MFDRDAAERDVLGLAQMNGLAVLLGNPEGRRRSAGAPPIPALGAGGCPPVGPGVAPRLTSSAVAFRGPGRSPAGVTRPPPGRLPIGVHDVNLVSPTRPRKKVHHCGAQKADPRRRCFSFRAECYNFRGLACSIKKLGMPSSIAKSSR